MTLSHLHNFCITNAADPYCFFFSSRRRHTRWPRDWSSDVCSSDLDGNREYPGAGPLTETPAPEGGGYLEEDSVETIELTDEQADELGLGEGAGGVYTRVTWTLPSAAERDAGTAQNWDEAVDASAAGEPGEFVIRYRAAVPLFENTLEWDG